MQRPCFPEMWWWYRLFLEGFGDYAASEGGMASSISLGSGGEGGSLEIMMKIDGDVVIVGG